MSTTPTQTPTSGGYSWPTEVLEYTQKHQVTHYLQPLLDAIGRLFPSATVEVSLHIDPELRDMQWVYFDVQVPESDFPDLLRADRTLGDEQFQICPASLAHHFVLSVRRLK